MRKRYNNCRGPKQQSQTPWMQCLLCCWADHISKPAGQQAHSLFGTYKHKTIIMELDCRVTLHLILSVCDLVKGFEYVFLSPVSKQNLYLGNFKFYFLHKEMFSITRFQDRISQTTAFLSQWHGATS